MKQKNFLFFLKKSGRKEGLDHQQMANITTFFRPTQNAENKKEVENLLILLYFN